MHEVKLADLTERYAFCDPASGRTVLKHAKARSAIVVLAVDDLSRLFVLHAWATRCPTDRLIDEILKLAEQYRPRLFGIEANAMQVLFADAVMREARYRGKTLPLTAIMQPTKIDKNWRIRTALQPVIAEGRLFVQPTQHELKHELTSFPMSPLKDLVDALASAVTLVPPRTTRVQRDDEREALADYLRRSGMPPAHIEARLQELAHAEQ